MTYSIEYINVVISNLINKTKKSLISKILNISIMTINKWEILYRENIINKTFLINYKSAINIHGLNKKNKYIESIINYVDNNEGCSLNDIKINATQNNLSNASICRILKENNITRKKIQNRIVCKNIDKIKEDRTLFANYKDNDNLIDYISIDETSFCINNLKNYGYSKSNKEIKKLIKHKHNKERYSLLAAINKSKIVAYEIYKDSLDAVKYKNFIEINKNKFINKTIIQDNVRLHHAKIVKEFAKENNIIMKYIPAYTPEFNPIEQVFNQIKNNFRKYDHTNIIVDIEKSLSVIKKEHLINYYNNTIKIINSYKSN
jgi:transposase